MRTYLKNLSSKELESLKFISDYELTIFSFEQIRLASELNRFELQDILTIYTKKGILFRLEKGIYCIRNFRNPYVIANHLAKDSAIAYWSALNVHGLTEQIPNVVYVQSSNRKKDKKVFNVRYKFIQVKAEKVCGITEIGYGNEKFRITDIEKTLLDCFDLPQYSGGYEELIRAFAQTKISGSKLLKYGKQINNLSVLKRMGYLSELYEIANLKEFRNDVLKIINNRYSLLDPLSENAGAFNSKWKIRMNITEQKLLEIANKIY